MNRFAHANASSVEEATGALSERCRPLGGGTDLLGLMKEGLAAPEQLVNLKAIPALDQIRVGGHGWRVGASTRLSQLVAHASFNQLPEFACLREAVLQSATPQLRHMATIAGNLLQQPRCWYYRNRLIPCWRKGGRRCFALHGENKYHTILGRSPCHAVHPSDPAVALAALGASIVAVGPAGRRAIPLSGLYRFPTRDDRGNTALGGKELITEVDIPVPRAGSRGTYVKMVERGSWDFALVSVAVQLAFSAEVVDDVHIALGGVAAVPWRASAAEDALKGKALSVEVIEQAAEAATDGARPLEHNAYKIDLLRGAVRQALQSFGREGQ